MNTSKVERIIFKGVMYGESNGMDALEALWRISGGSREKAYQIICATAAHYTKEVVEDIDITLALARINGGCEVEWSDE